MFKNVLLAALFKLLIFFFTNYHYLEVIFFINILFMILLKYGRNITKDIHYVILIIFIIQMGELLYNWFDSSLNMKISIGVLIIVAIYMYVS